jgi:HEAT repeat protein
MSALKDEMATVRLVNSLKNRHASVRRHAAKVLGKQKLDPSLALRQFSKSLRDCDEQVRISAINGLEKLGPTAVAILAQALSHPDKQVRREAAWALGRMGSQARPAVGALAEALKDTDLRVAQGAARSLGMIGPGAEPAILALMGVLDDSNFLICRLAAWSLGQIGPAAVPGLVQALQAAEIYVRCEAAWALAQMGPKACDAVPALCAALRSEEARCLFKSDGPPASDPDLDTTVPVFIPPRNGTPEAFCLLVVKALGEIGPAAREAVPELAHLAEAGQGTAQVVAHLALKQIEQAVA